MRSSAAQQQSSGVNSRVQLMLAKQQHDLVKNPANGIIFYQNEDGNVLDIQADIIGPVQTAYEGGIFRCKLVIESGFPQSAPKGYFLTKIFHPNVAVNTGEICVNTLKRDWNPAKWSLKHIFEVIKCLLIVPFPESSLNEEAGREFMGDYESFVANASVFTQIHAKPNTAQKELILQRRLEEQKQSQSDQQTASTTQTVDSITSTRHQQTPSSHQYQLRPPTTVNHVSSTGTTFSQENSTATSSQTSTVSSDAITSQTQQQREGQQPSHVPIHVGIVSLDKPNFNLSMQQQPISNQTSPADEEMKLAITDNEQPSSHMVLSQVTNRPKQSQSNSTQDSQMGFVKGQTSQSQLHMLPLGVQVTTQGNYNNGKQVGTIGSQQSFVGAYGSQSFGFNDEQNMMIDTTMSGEGRTMSQPQIIRRPSVLYKKKVETAKQRQDRYIRRV